MDLQYYCVTGDNKIKIILMKIEWELSNSEKNGKMKKRW